MKREKTAEDLVWERRCYGCLQEDIDRDLNSVFFKEMPLMYAMSVLSDAQEMLERDYPKDEVRQLMNKAKYVMSKQMKTRG